MPAETIDEVVEQLDLIIDRARNSRSRLGFFPALYRRVTLAVQAGITPRPMNGSVKLSLPMPRA